MRKFILLPLSGTLCILFSSYAYAECTTGAKTYTACKPGYYLSYGDCVRCPSSGGVYGTTVDNNTGGITSCYLPSGTTGSDSTGSYTITGSCYYSM